MDATKRALMNVSGLDLLGAAERIGRLLLKPFRVYRAWNRTQRERKMLLSMNDHMLKDLGISRVDALQYANGRMPRDLQ